MGETYLTKKGFEKLRAEHRLLQKQKRQLTEEVNKAAAMGDLRENAEYHAARERLQQICGRLSDLDEKLTRVRLIDHLDLKADEARIGAKVTLEDERTKERVTYVLVGSDEADPSNGRLSISSPLGKSLLGKKQGDQFKLELPRSIVPYRLVRIERTSG